MREVVFYKTDSGVSPIEEFLDSLSSKQAQRATWVLSLIEDLDSIPKSYFKKLTGTDDLWEVRVQRAERISGCWDSGKGRSSLF